MIPIRTDSATRARYSEGAGIYRIVPAAVARPRDAAELARVLAWASERDLAVIPRGAGTGMAGGNVGEGLVVDLTAFGRPGPAINPATRLVIADAGIPLAAITAAAAGHGLRFLPDPSSAEWASVGGVVSTNAAGPRSFRHGAVDRWVAGLDLVTSEGLLTLDRGRPVESRHPVADRFANAVAPLLDAHRDAVLARTPSTSKQATGYGLARYHHTGDLVDLVIGSEGTLGIVTAARLRLVPEPAACATVELTLDDRDQIADVVAHLRQVRPVAIELFDASFLRVVHEGGVAIDGPAGRDGAAAVLLVELEADSDAAIDAGLAAALPVPGLSAGRVRIARAPRDRRALWSLRHRASPMLAGLADGRRSLQVIEDGCVPLHALATYLEAVERACRGVGIDAVMFGHAGDGHVHVNLLPDMRRTDWLDAVRQVYLTVADTLEALGGTPSGEHGIGRIRAPLLERFLGPEAVADLHAIKRCFDPTGRFNPGVLLAAGGDPLSRLKVGPDAAPIPSDVAQWLRDVEVARRWDASRWPNAGAGA